MLKPLRDLVLIEREEVVSEEVRPSGIVALKSNFNLYQWGAGFDVSAADIIEKKKQNKGTVICCGKGCSFFKPGDNIIYIKMAEEKYIIYEGKDCVLVSEKNILCKTNGEKMICHPENVIVKISKDAWDGLFTKKIKRDDGQVIDLFVYNPTTQEDTDHNLRYVASGEVVSIGEKITNVEVGDIALLDYLVDTDEKIIVGYDGEDKLIVASPVTQYTKKEEWVYANRMTERDPKKKSFGHRLCPHDIQIQKIGDYEVLAPIMGVVRNDELIAFDPFVFLQHEDNVVQRVSKSGILYSETQKIFERKVLAASENSTKKYGLKIGNQIVVDDFDIFDLVVGDKKVHCMNDVDIIVVKN